MKYKCQECNIRFCAILCFEVYHTKLHIWESTDAKMEEQNTQMSVNTTIEITELKLFRSIFLMKNGV